jgi:hypothetical protein
VVVAHRAHLVLLQFIAAEDDDLLWRVLVEQNFDEFLPK